MTEKVFFRKGILQYTFNDIQEKEILRQYLKSNYVK